MSTIQRISAAISYIPVIGWLYVLLAQRQDPFARFHLRQSIGLILGMILVFVVWIVGAWVLAWVPYLDVIAVALFSLVIAAWIAGIIAWLVGIINALRGRMDAVPLFSGLAKRLPI